MAPPLLAAKSIGRSQSLCLPAGMGTTTGSAPLPSAADPLAILGSTMTGEGGRRGSREACRYEQQTRIISNYLKGPS